MNSQRLLYFSVSQHNILPLTSRCGVSCLFCSHRYNPPGVQAGFFGELGIDVVLDLMDLLDPKRKIVIGESATRLCEGEPFIHPQFSRTIELLRRRFANTPIQITTNAIGLCRDNLHLLAHSQPLELVISLNSANPEIRSKLMGSHDAAQTLENICSLAQYEVPWHSSLVLMPHVTGWADIDNSLNFAAQNGAKTMRLLLPGFSGLAPMDWQALSTVPGEAQERLEGWRQSHPHMPITLEPALPQDLRAIIAGVLAHSSASGLLLPGDEILTINDGKPFSRVDAFHTLYRLADPRLIVSRDGMEIPLTLLKSARCSSGVVVDRDLDPNDLERALDMAAGAERVLLLTSAWAQPLWCQVVPSSWNVLAVPSVFFGGNIAASGLLTVQDYQLVLAKLDLTGYDKILLPPISFDEAGLDLRGEDCRDLARVVPIPLAWA